MIDAYGAMRRGIEPKSNYLPAFVEYRGVFLKYVPSSWRSFIRFVKYWTAIHCSERHVYGAIVEDLCLKVLIKRDPSFKQRDINLLECLTDYLNCWTDESELSKISNVVLPGNTFESFGIMKHNESYEKCGIQPKLSVDWATVTQPDHSGCDLFDRVGYDLSSRHSVKDLDMSSRRLYEKLINDSPVYVKDVFENAIMSVGSTRRRLRTFVKRFMMVAMLLLIFAALTTVAFFFVYLDTDGELSQTRLHRSIGVVEDAFIHLIDRMQQNDMGPILDSSAFGLIEDSLGTILEYSHGLPLTWRNAVSLQGRLRLARFYKNSQLSLTSMTRHAYVFAIRVFQKLNKESGLLRQVWNRLR